MDSNTFSIERVVTLLTPLFATGAAWLCAFVGTHVPGAPHLDPSAVEGVEAAAFLGTVGIVFKWLHGRQLPAIAGLGLSPGQLADYHAEIEAYLAAHPVRPDVDAIVQAVVARITQGLGSAAPPAPASPESAYEPLT